MNSFDIYINGKIIDNINLLIPIKLIFVSLVAVIFTIQLTKAQRNLDLETKSNNNPGLQTNFGNFSNLLILDNVNHYESNYFTLLENLRVNLGFKAYSYPLSATTCASKNVALNGSMRSGNNYNISENIQFRVAPWLVGENAGNRRDFGGIKLKRYMSTQDTNSHIEIEGLLIRKNWFNDPQRLLGWRTFHKISTKPEINPAKARLIITGALVGFSDFDTAQIEALTLLGKVWGLMKYHHPEIAVGKYQWDEELLKFLPVYLKSTKSAERDKALINWIGSYGGIPICENCQNDPSVGFLKPDFQWIYEENISAQLSAKLTYIQKNRFQGDRFYVTSSKIGKIEIVNEKPYKKSLVLDSGYRLLALYRYWNIIQYFYPHKGILSKNWGSVLSQYIPEFIAAKSQIEYEFAIQKLIGEIQDSHAFFDRENSLTLEWIGSKVPALRARFIHDTLVVSETFSNQCLKKGDIITKIEHKTVEERIAQLQPYFMASNEAATLRDLSYLVLRSNNDSLHVNYIRDGIGTSCNISTYSSQELKNITRQEPVSLPKSSSVIDSIGYLDISKFRENDVKDIIREFKNCNGFILDARGYPYKNDFFSLAPYFIPKNTQYVKYGVANLDRPGEFNFTENYKILRQKKVLKGDLIILVNEYTQSNAEFVAVMFRAREGTKVLGSTTAGVDGKTTVFSLPGEIRTSITGMGCYYPDGKGYQITGVIPDIVCYPTTKGVQEEKDELLMKALEILREK